MVKAAMIRITNLLVLLIVALFILPATATVYASGSTDINDASDRDTSDNSDGSSDSGLSENKFASDKRTTASNNTGSVQQQSADFENTILNIHNQERAAVNVPALLWSNSIATDAKNWADHITTLGLGSNDLAPHASWEQRNGQGENLAWGSTGFFSPAEGVQM